MARNNETMKPTKNKKPANQQHKTVYFNTDNRSDEELFDYAQSVGVRNFSGWVKSLIYQEKIRRNGVPPNPYEYAGPVMQVETAPEPRTVPVRVRNKQKEVENKFEEFTEPPVKKEVPSLPPYEEDPEDEFDDFDEPEDEKVEDVIEETATEAEDEPEPAVDARASAAARMASMYKRK